MVRPRTVSPSDEELEKLGEHLIEWCNKDKKNLLFPEFYTSEIHMLRKEWKAIIQQPAFLPYYEEARSILGKRHITGGLKDSIAHRFIRLYHQDVREDEDEIRKKDNEKAQGPQNVTYNINYDSDDPKQVLSQNLPAPDIEGTG